MATLVGEAAVRIIPSMRGFHSRLERELKRRPHHIDVQVFADTDAAEAQMRSFRLRQELNAITVPVRTDFSGFRRDLSTVEHIFKKNATSRAIRLNVKVLGLDALPALAYAAGGAASALDAVGKTAFTLPSLLSAAGASAGALAVGLSGVSDAFTTVGRSAEESAQASKAVRDADRDLIRSKRDLVTAVRDQRREMEDLNAEMRRSSLNEADALLSVQEDAQRLREGGFRSITDFQRAQLNYLKSVDNLQAVRTRSSRLQEDVNRANERGVLGSDRVSDALGRVADATEKVNEATKALGESDLDKAMAKLSPNAQSFVTATKSMSDAWTGLRNTVQDSLFDDLDKAIVDLGQRALPGLEVGLSRVASGVNANFRTVAESLGNNTNQGLLERIFGNTDGGLTALSRAMNPLVESFLRLSAVGSDALPRLGTAAEAVFSRFDNFIARTEGDGSLARWIDQGLDALTNFGNALVNVGSVISSIGDAWNTVSGNAEGFFGWLEGATGRLAEALRSVSGQQQLIGYFNRAREFMNDLSESFSSIMPLISDMVDLARSWSQGMLWVVGGLTEAATWIEKNTGLLKPLVFGYLTIRTLRPIWDAVTTGAKNYYKVMVALADYQRTNPVFGPLTKNLQKAKSQFSAIGSVAAGAASPLQLTHVALDKNAKNAGRLIAPSNNAASSLNLLGNSALTASGKIGVSRASGARNLFSAVGNLAKFLGPAIGAGAFGIAVGAALAGINKLGEAHRNAADDADRQKQSLDALAGSLDQISGAVNPQTLMQIARGNQKYAQPGLGDRNLNEDIARAGLGTPQDLMRAQLPTNQSFRDSFVARGDAALKAKLLASEEWQRHGKAWESRGVDIDTWVKAANNDPASLEKVRAAERDMIWGPDPGGVRRGLAIDRGDAAPDLLATINAIGGQDIVSVTGAARGVSNRLAQEGADIQQANQAAYGSARLTPAGAARFGSAGANDSKVFLDNDVALIEVDRPVDLDPELGTVSQLNPGQWQIRLTAEGVDRYVQKFADGGLIGGIGSGTSDSNLLLGSKGEFVTRKAAVDHYGVDFFNRLNSMQLPKLNTGGMMPLNPNPKVPDIDYDYGTHNVLDVFTGRPVGGGGIIQPFGRGAGAGKIPQNTRGKMQRDNTKNDAFTGPGFLPHGIGDRDFGYAWALMTGNKERMAELDREYDEQPWNWQGEQNYVGHHNSIGGNITVGKQWAADNVWTALRASPLGAFATIVDNIKRSKPKPPEEFRGWFDPTMGPEGRVVQDWRKGRDDAWGVSGNDPYSIPDEYIDPFAEDFVPSDHPGYRWIGPGDPALKGVLGGGGGFNSTFQGSPLLGGGGKFNEGGQIGADGKKVPDVAGAYDRFLTGDRPASSPKPGRDQTRGISVVGQAAGKALGSVGRFFKGALGIGDPPEGYGETRAATVRPNKPNMGLPSTGQALSNAAGFLLPSEFGETRTARIVPNSVKYPKKPPTEPKPKSALSSLGQAFSVDGMPGSGGTGLPAMLGNLSGSGSSLSRPWGVDPATGKPWTNSKPSASKPSSAAPSSASPSRGAFGVQPAASSPKSSTAHGTTGRAPIGPTPHGLTGRALPGPGNATQNLGAISQRTGLPPGVVARSVPMSVLSQPNLTGSGSYLLEPYGLAPGSNITYGSEGFPTWVYRLSSRFGLQASTYPGHQEGSGVNRGIDFSGPPESMRALAEYLAYSGLPGVEQVIFMDGRDGTKIGLDPGDRGPGQSIEDYYRDDWAGHADHVHARFANSVPLPEELFAAGSPLMMASGLVPGLGGVPVGLGSGSGSGRNDPFSNENISRFLADQASGVGSSLLQIGLGFLGGITGLDFSSVVGYGQTIGNEIMGRMGQNGTGFGPGGLNSLAQQEMEAYISDSPSLAMTGGLDWLLGPEQSIGLAGPGFSYNPGGGAEQWRPVVRQVVEALAEQYGIENVQAWEDALVKQIATESAGNPNSFNPNDSNGKGGTQQVAGLLNFLDTTFANHNVFGTDYLDPVGQIAAAIDYVTSKYGMNADGSPKQIGRGVGFAQGGLLKGLGGPRSDSNIVRVSRGEFLHNARAVEHYGPGFFSSLNAMQIPKESLPGFAGGMWWNPFASGPGAAPAPPKQPAPKPPPQKPVPPPPPPASAGAQSPGPLPLTPPAAAAAEGASQTAASAPSTGGAPGPGATAPASDPGALPGVADALSGIGGAISGGVGGAQPGASPGEEGDPRATLGQAPESQDHTVPWLSSGIQGAAGTIGSLMNTAIQAGAAGATMGGSALAGGMGAGQAGQIAQAGAQIAGEVATGAVNVLSSLMVGTLSGGSTAQASGIPLLPERPPVQTGVPPMQRIHNGDINVTNLDEFKRTQERMDAQAQMPWIGKY